MEIDRTRQYVRCQAARAPTSVFDSDNEEATQSSEEAKHIDFDVAKNFGRRTRASKAGTAQEEDPLVERSSAKRDEGTKRYPSHHSSSETFHTQKSLKMGMLTFKGSKRANLDVHIQDFEHWACLKGIDKEDFIEFFP